MRELSINDIKNKMKNKGYSFFENGDYNLNIIAVRNPNNVSDAWDDSLYVIYKENNEWRKFFVSEFTTDPGRHSLQNPKFTEAIKNGTAILKPGQYRSAYKLLYHITPKHPALIQVLPLTIYRDNNRDQFLDTQNVKETTGLYGINIHSTRPEWEGLNVVDWSAGCQVIKNWEVHKRFIALCTTASKIWGDRFTYTLLDDI